jgi:RNA-directed DNA polymerase
VLPGRASAWPWRAVISPIIKIKADANPHDPTWAPYFEIRWGKKMLRSSKDRGKLHRVWQRQDGLCSTCQASITTSTPWEARRIVKKMQGGSDAASNLQMHHLNCRKNQVHAHNAVV